MKTLPISVPHSVAQHYHRDARDFAGRFDILWESQLHKTGRIKSFVDLVMGCECALKCHIFLGQIEQDPEITYKSIRRAGHKVDELSKLAAFMHDRTIYDLFGTALAPFSVFVRYSLDAYSTFFPALTDRSNAPINYTETIGNNQWVLGLREHLDLLIQEASPEFTGIVNNDIAALFEHEEHMAAFMQQVAPNNSFKPTPHRGVGHVPALR